jgi:hypothetical protein
MTNKDKKKKKKDNLCYFMRNLLLEGDAIWIDKHWGHL